MKIQLLILFLAASMAVEENQDYDDWESYDLLKCEFPNIVFLCKLDSHLLFNKTGAIPCYEQFRGELEKIAANYKTDIVNNQNYHMQIMNVPHRLHAINILKTIKKLATELVSCQTKLWDRMQKNQTEYGSGVIFNCKKTIDDFYKEYQNELNSITDPKNRNIIQKKVDGIHKKVEDNFRKYNGMYESCVENF